jgi:ferric iron reductase protein FhuF
MTKDDREAAFYQLYRNISTVELEIESDMDTLIEEGLTPNVSAPLHEITEITLRLLRSHN